MSPSPSGCSSPPPPPPPPPAAPHRLTTAPSDRGARGRAKRGSPAPSAAATSSPTACLTDAAARRWPRWPSDLAERAAAPSSTPRCRPPPTGPPPHPHRLPEAKGVMPARWAPVAPGRAMTAPAPVVGRQIRVRFEGRRRWRRRTPPPTASSDGLAGAAWARGAPYRQRGGARCLVPWLRGRTAGRAAVD
jgi:hypothetical protein